MKETIKIFNSRMEAQMAKSYLESNGIKSYISSDDAGQMYPSQQLVGGVLLMVEKEDKDLAQKLLNREERDKNND
ncbi:MAG: putative signal transducing protein [Actinomycetota bacterium]